ncbi:glycosyltransferase, partial [Klebsiella pneumoniae]|nr:glycosyltransferase [Klebsiella pneumoniae]
YKNLEIIVVDDFSRDETSQYVKQKCNEDKRIIYVRNEKNMGACYSRNIAIQMAKGKYITGLDDDDYFLPERVLDFHNNADKINGDICLLYTD